MSPICFDRAEAYVAVGAVAVLDQWTIRHFAVGGRRRRRGPAARRRRRVHAHVTIQANFLVCAVGAEITSVLSSSRTWRLRIATGFIRGWIRRRVCSLSGFWPPV